MDWQSVQNVALIALLSAAIAIALLRTPPARRRIALMLLPLPAGFLLYRWARFRDAWLELGIALVLAIVLVAAWWYYIGRELPPPKESEIRVWSEDDPF